MNSIERRKRKQHREEDEYFYYNEGDIEDFNQNNNSEFNENQDEYYNININESNTLNNNNKQEIIQQNTSLFNNKEELMESEDVEEDVEEEEEEERIENKIDIEPSVVVPLIEVHFSHKLHIEEHMEFCLLCGSTGDNSNLIFCHDCGECYHTFCLNPPIQLKNLLSIEEWRCPHCKFCEKCIETHSEDKLIVCDKVKNLKNIFFYYKKK